MSLQQQRYSCMKEGCKVKQKESSEIVMQVEEAQKASGTDSAPGTAQQQQQQADALSAAAQQPDNAAAILSEAAKPLEAPEPDQYTVSPQPYAACSSLMSC